VVLRVKRKREEEPVDALGRSTCEVVVTFFSLPPDTQWFQRLLNLILCHVELMQIKEYSI
jgi:hypothetical protein